MTSFEIQRQFLEFIKKYNIMQGRALADVTDAKECYVALFNRWPKHYYISKEIDTEKTCKKFKESFDCFFPDYLIQYKSDSKPAEVCYGGTILFDGTLIRLSRSLSEIYSNKSLEELYDYFVDLNEENPSSVYWVTRETYSFETNKIELKFADFNISTHYNDDFDYNKINKFINSDESGIILLHGLPSSGKTFCLRHLAQSNPKKAFYFIDRNTLEYVGEAQFVSFLKDAENSVIILEDCESLLQDRNQGNTVLSTILNLADGLIGDELKLKFICTFNANPNMIDKAVLRKGRLKYKYEFKALTPEKTAALAKELGKNIPDNMSLTVGDIYNYDEDINVESRSSIGFSKFSN